MNLRFHWMLPKGGEIAVRTAKETAAFAPTAISAVLRPASPTWRAG